MAKASRLEQFMLRLINQERAKAGLDPLRFDGDLNEAAENHSEWMINRDVFSHTGAGGSSSTQRMKKAGYELKHPWSTGENIALQSERGASHLFDDVRDLHQRLMNSPEHRKNILSPKFDEIGIGIERGMFRLNGNTFDSVVVTQDFGRTAARNVPRQEAAPADADTFVLRSGGSDPVGWAAPGRQPESAAQEMLEERVWVFLNGEGDGGWLLV